MLFKTLSASVYGIDAYLVEVEVDVGSCPHPGLQRGRLAGQRGEGKPRAHQVRPAQLLVRISARPRRDHQFGSRRRAQRRLSVRPADGARLGWLYGPFLRQASG